MSSVFTVSPLDLRPVVLNLGVIRHFPRGRNMYSVFVRNLFVAYSNVVGCVFCGNDATPEEFVAARKITTR